ncbi:MAG TPA: DUF3052 domain-containing protein [Candidatus Dormibacteraeota bacterium]|jgi:hypothetical protein|nr:DUF3052 domain-containing protein [Candidatus Dormibacteraeota bacterium]
MGAETPCRLHRNGRVLDGRALLETDELIFRGDERVRVALGEIVSVAVRDGSLIVGTRDEQLQFDVGRSAERWAEKIRNPRTLVDKLGVKPGMRVAVDGILDAAPAQDLAQRGAETVDTGADVLLLGVEDADSLPDRIATAWPRVAAGGALWIVYPKGVRAVTEGDVLAAGRAAGLLDIKVARFSATHTALRFVAPRAAR